MTDEKLIEQVARVIIGPREPVPEGSQYSLETLRVIRWDHAENSLRNDALWAARAILPIIKAERIRGGEMVKEAAIQKSYAWCPSHTGLNTVGDWLRKDLCALSVPAIVEAGDETR